MFKSGILLIDKPRGITSHDVVDIVRRKFGIQQVGHAGTLDPLATGLLLILVGCATKKFNSFMNLDKEYTACLTLGTSTNSGDSQGKAIKSLPYDGVDQADVVRVLKSLEGQIESVPPMVSAIKMGGERLYKLARKGIVVDRPARKINIYKLELRGFHLPDIVFNLKCSKGTYVRSLSEEIAKRLNCAGHITQIRRESIGNYSVINAKKVDDFNENDIQLA